MNDQASDAVGLIAAKTATYGGGASAMYFGLTANEVAAFGGLLIGLIGLCVQWYYNRRRDAREREMHVMEIEMHTARIKRLL